jgi:hypothetical protein
VLVVTKNGAIAVFVNCMGMAWGPKITTSVFTAVACALATLRGHHRPRSS